MADVNWLDAQITVGLQQLILLRLKGSPAGDTVVDISDLWFQIAQQWPIQWNQKLDQWRVEKGFALLASRVSEWPAPVQLREALPKRVYQQDALQRSHWL